MHIHIYTCSRTCDGESARAVGLSSVILSKAGVYPLIIDGGVEDLQTPIIQNGNPKNENGYLAKLLDSGWLGGHSSAGVHCLLLMLTDRELLKSSSLPFVQVNRGLGAARGLHSITTRPSLAPRSCFFTGFNSNVGAQAEGRL